MRAQVQHDIGDSNGFQWIPSPKTPASAARRRWQSRKRNCFLRPKRRWEKLGTLLAAGHVLLNLLQFWSVDLFPPPFVGQVRTSLDQFEVEFHGGISAFAQGDEDAAALAEFDKRYGWSPSAHLLHNR